MISSTLTVDSLTTPAAFTAARDGWNALAHDSAETVFLTHAWLSNWLTYLGQDREPLVLTARDGDRLVAALPLARRVRRPGVRTLEFMGAGVLTPNHLDLLAQPQWRDGALEAFAEWLLDKRDTWDVIDLDKLPEDSPTGEMLRDRCSAEGMTTSLEVSAVCPYAELPATYDDFFASLTKSARRHTRERIRCIEREHPAATFGMVRTSEELERALAALVRLHQLRWEGRGYAGSFADTRVVDFHRATAREALSEGFLRFYTLTEGDDVAACVMCYRMNGYVQAYSCAFEPSWSAYRPGMVLGAYAIEQSIAEGASRYDHLEGDEAHKTTWAGHERRNLRLHVFGNTARGRLARTAMRARSRAIETARRVVPADVRESAVKRLSRLSARS